MCPKWELTCVGNETKWSVLISLPYSAEENAERIMLDPTSRENLKFKDLLKVSYVVLKHRVSSGQPEQ